MMDFYEKMVEFMQTCEMAIASVLSKIFLESVETLRRSLPMINGLAERHQIANCVCSLHDRAIYQSQSHPCKQNKFGWWWCVEEEEEEEEEDGGALVCSLGKREAVATRMCVVVAYDEHVHVMPSPAPRRSSPLQQASASRHRGSPRPPVVDDRRHRPPSTADIVPVPPKVAPISRHCCERFSRLIVPQSCRPGATVAHVPAAFACKIHHFECIVPRFEYTVPRCKVNIPRI